MLCLGSGRTRTHLRLGLGREGRGWRFQHLPQNVISGGVFGHASFLMAHSFLAYIDESGDDGLANFRQPGQGGASRWLVISACVFRSVHDLSAVKWRDAALGLMPERGGKDLHFYKFNHQQKLAVARKLAENPLRAINIMADKTVIPAGMYPDKNQLYFYMTRYLIERVSWLCRANATAGDEGRCKITFSRRGGMSYADFRSYMTRLQQMNTEIHWPCIDVDGIDAKDHSKLASLQLADAIASAFAAGVELDAYGNAEYRYAEAFKRATYAHGAGANRYLSYGVKIVPPVENLALTPDQTRFVDLFR